MSTAGAAPHAVELAGVAIAFRLPAGGLYEAVDPTDLTVGAQEFVAIVGPTGCGKSTLLNVAAGLIQPHKGIVQVLGQRLAGLNAAAGYLFQQDALMPWKRAIDNVAIGLEVAGVARTEAIRRAQHWLTRVGLGAFADRYPHLLSGGQRKRVALAQVLIRDPRILLMDEPFGPLDAQTRLIMGDLLLKLWSDVAADGSGAGAGANASRKAVMFVTHDLEEAIALADRVVIMSAGPNSRIIGNYPIPIPRPRDIAEVKLEPQFHAIHREIWNTLKAEVIKGYQQAG